MSQLLKKGQGNPPLTFRLAISFSMAPISLLSSDFQKAMSCTLSPADIEHHGKPSEHGLKILIYVPNLVELEYYCIQCLPNLLVFSVCLFLVLLSISLTALHESARQSAAAALSLWDSEKWAWFELCQSLGSNLFPKLFLKAVNQMFICQSRGHNYHINCCLLYRSRTWQGCSRFERCW